MSRQFSREFYADVRAGLIPGYSCVHKFGRNDAVANATWEHVSLIPFNTNNFPQRAENVRIKAGGNANDTGAGTGAREVTVQGIDSDFNETSEAITTVGGVSAFTTTRFWRVHRAWVSSVGTYTGANAGEIVIESGESPSVDLISIAASEGQTQYAGWTVPTGKTAYLVSLHISVDAVNDADIRVFAREDIDTVTAPMKSKRLKLFFDGIAGEFHYNPSIPDIQINQKSDIWVEARGAGASTEVSVDFELLVIDN